MVPLRFLRRLIRPSWRRPYHYLVAWAAAVRYGFPSRKLIVIGITGTDGKTTTATLTAAALRASDQKVGLSSTVWFQVGDTKKLNTSHMTMPGRFTLQRMLREMVDAGCHYAVLEVSSEGLAQGRLQGIDIDVAVLTNISPEHIQSHGTLDRYIAAKKKLFTSLSASRRKFLFGRAVPKVAVVNLDDDRASAFLDCKADELHGTSVGTLVRPQAGVEIHHAKDVQVDAHKGSFTLEHTNFTVCLPGRHNIVNALQAATIAHAVGVPYEVAKQGIATVDHIPGRYEVVDAGHDRKVIIDYAVTPAAFRALYSSLDEFHPKKVIAVFGAAGGGRDAWKRPELGAIVAEYATHIILTSEDPFNEDPQKIAEAILAGVPSEKRSRVEVETDRRLAIKRALELAQGGDVIVLTGMGAETTMNVAGGKQVTWNDREVVESLVGM